MFDLYAFCFLQSPTNARREAEHLRTCLDYEDRVRYRRACGYPKPFETAEIDTPSFHFGHYVDRLNTPSLLIIDNLLRIRVTLEVKKACREDLDVGRMG